MSGGRRARLARPAVRHPGLRRVPPCLRSPFGARHHRHVFKIGFLAAPSRAAFRHRAGAAARPSKRLGQRKPNPKPTDTPGFW